MGDVSTEKKSGCGLLNAVFGRRSWPRRTTSTGSLPRANENTNHFPRIPSTPISKRQKDGSDEASFLDDETIRTAEKQVDRIVPRPAPNYAKSAPENVYAKSAPGNVYLHHQTPPVYHQNQNQGRSDAVSNQGYAGVGRKVAQGTAGLSGELDSMIADHQRSTGASNLVRASSSNVMLFGNLGNLRQGGGVGGNNNSNMSNVLDHLPRTAREDSSSSAPNGKYPTSVMGNEVKKQNDQESTEKPTSLCRAISTRMDPEQLKILGNEDYKNGRFAEALALYDAAISIDPNKASYRSNKSAALTALGRLLEAVFECREAIRIEPYYQRAHNRLATLYVRLGEAEKAIYHYKLAGAEADPDLLTKARKLQVHLNKCTEAKMQRDWSTLLRETSLALSAGADSAPQIFALKSEALVKLQRHQDADENMKSGPKFHDDECTKFLGPIGNAILLVIRAQVDMVAGRFEDAVAAAQLAARLDANNKEANILVRRTRAVATARSNGNDLFKVGRYSEACVAYGEGLNHDPYNAVLLCNRAACRSKLGQHEKALEDCNAALNVRPSYSKARLRRSDCFAKLQKWEACVQDCEMLLKDSPEDEEVGQMLKDAQAQLRKQQGGQAVKRTNHNGNDAAPAHSSGIIVVSSNERFRDYITSPGVSVVLFCNKPGDKPTIQLLEQLQKRYQSVNFLKVEVEEQPALAKSEGVNSLPAFKIYKSGSRTKEISGSNHELLESTIRLYIS